MQKKDKMYKEGDLVRIRTNKCNVHLMEMFGHCEFNPDVITADEYIALITAVIRNGQCYSVTIFAPHGECYYVIENNEIIGPANIDDLPESKRDKANWKNPIDDISFTASKEMYEGLSSNTKRLSLALAAVGNLNPEGIIRVVEMSPSQSFLREAIYGDIDKAWESCNNLSKERRAELEKRKGILMKWFDSLQFEEHYEYHIGVDELCCKAYEDPDNMEYYIVAVNEEGSKAYVMKTRADQNLFFNYLGPDFKNMHLETHHFCNECKTDSQDNDN